tara:strand:+ start:122 stop:403 length:282 start_codon:yes stop_codon:yes gene_type:complete
MKENEDNVIHISKRISNKKEDLIDSDLFKQVASIVEGIDGALEIDDDLVEVTGVNIGVLLTNLVEYFGNLDDGVNCLQDIVEEIIATRNSMPQ